MLARFLAGLSACLSQAGRRRILVALSGGADSVALLHLCHQAGLQVGEGLAACHVHHHLRGADADRDENFCAELCRRLAVPFHVAHIEPGHPPGISPEEHWRRQRYAVLESVRRSGDYDAVATGHTLDDQAETVLLKLLRGSGPRGLAGIRPRAGRVIRPLLEVERRDLRGYLVAAGEGWREDATNADHTLPRGWVRWRLLPMLERRNPAIRLALADLARILAADEEYLADRLDEEGVWPAVGRPVPLASVAALPPPLRRRWLLALASRLPLGEPPNREQVRQLEQLLAGHWPAAVDLGRRWVIRRRGGRLVLDPPPCRPFEAITMRAPGELELPGGFRVRLGVPPGEAAHVAYLDPAVGDRPVQWRSLRPGERLPAPDGRIIGPRLTRIGVPAGWRRAWPVLEADGTMIWVPGVGVADGWLSDHEIGMPAAMEEPWERHGK